MPASMYREPSSEVKKVGSAFIQDNGQLTRTAPGSTGNFLFTEVGAGVKPMVLIGSKPDVIAWLESWPGRGIENRISSLPEIYMSVQPYRPGARFIGLFPVQAAVQAIVEGIASFAPGSALTDLVGGVKDLKGAIEFSRGGAMSSVYSTSKAPPGPNPGTLYVRFHYLGGAHDTKVGERFLAWSAAAEIVRRVVA